MSESPDQRKDPSQGASSSTVSAWRYYIVGLLVFGPLAVLMCLKPIHQSLEYHSFADTRSVLRIPNTWNVVSNFPFLLVGLAGLICCYRRNLGPAHCAWFVFFGGIGLVSLGSAYYHWNPNNESLVWDRLPMTLGFMGLFIALLWEYTNSRLVRHLLMPALLLGISTVLYWCWTDDLRLYAWIQVMPLLTVPALMILFRSSYSHQWLLAIALCIYLVAKCAEVLDPQIYLLSGAWISGHTLKHLLSATACGCILFMLEKRQPLKHHVL